MSDANLILPKQPLNTEQVIERLATKFPAPAYAFITQVRRGTGYATAIRTADALAMSLFPSRGIFLTGFEVKVSRTDWLKELAEPSKADEIAQFCDYWYIVVGDSKIIKPGELPPTWGLIEPFGKGMKCVKEPSKLKAKNYDSSFVAGIMRNLNEKFVSKASIQEMLTAEYQRGKEWNVYEVKRTKDDLEKLQKSVNEFEKISGVKIDRWDNKDIGMAVKSVLEGKDKKAGERLIKLRTRAANILSFIDGENISEWDM